MSRNPDKYDLVIIGSGPGGYVAAIRAAQLGMNVAVIEKMNNPGGTCLNIGCIPSKALLESSELFFRTKNHFAEHGIFVKEFLLDLKTMMSRKDKIVKQFVNGVSLLLKSNKVTLYTGNGTLLSPTEVEITLDTGKKQTIKTKFVLLATGSVPSNLPFLPFDGKQIVSSTEALSFNSVPKKLVIMGAGAIGLELGSIWSRLGSEVTIIELMPQILPGMDSGVSKYLGQVLQRQGIKIYLSTTVKDFDKEKTQIKLHAQDPSGKILEFNSDKVLVAAGRTPYHQRLGIEKLDIKVDKIGRLLSVIAKRNQLKRLSTNIPKYKLNISKFSSLIF